MTREQYRAAQQQSKASAQGLPQTGNENSAAVLGLGALAGMFGLGLAAKGKKRF